MGIVNRTLDLSEQQESLKLNARTVINTLEVPVAVVERACVIQKLRTSCVGISGAPTGLLRVNRFGGASFTVGLTFLIPAMGTSGAMAGLSLPAAGSTTLNLQSGDVLTVLFGGGATAAADNIVVDVVVQNIQDIKTWY